MADDCVRLAHSQVRLCGIRVIAQGRRPATFQQDDRSIHRSATNVAAAIAADA